MQGASAAILAVIVAWPPFLLKAAIVKPALMYTGLLLKPYPSVRPSGSWMRALAATHPLTLALAALGIIVLFVPGRRARSAFVPTLAFVAGFMLLNFRVSVMKPLYASDVMAPLVALAAATAGLAAWRLAPALVRPLTAAVIGAALFSGLWHLGTPRTDRPWRRSLQDLAHRFAGQRLLVTPRAAGAMVIYYLNASDVVLDSSDPDDKAELKRALASRRIDVVFQWGGFVERDGLGAETISARPPDGTAPVSSSIVSWWRVQRE